MTLLTAVEQMVGAALLPVYRPMEPVIVGGRGSYLITQDGRELLDFTSGIGVNAFGYADPELQSVISNALSSGLIHTSNLFRTQPAKLLAERAGRAELRRPRLLLQFRWGSERRRNQVRAPVRSSEGWCGEARDHRAQGIVSRPAVRHAGSHRSAIVPRSVPAGHARNAFRCGLMTSLRWLLLQQPSGPPRSSWSRCRVKAAYGR